MIRIVTDSTCDLPPEWFQEYDLTVVPVSIQFGTDSYKDGVTIDRATFYRKIDELGVLPTTSQPSAGEFAEYYNRLAEEGATDIISLHVTAKLSGTYHSAVLAQELVEDRVRVHPFDSAGGTVQLGFMAVEASRMARAGKSVDEILARMELIRQRTNLIIVLKDLRYAQMSGRVGKLQSSLASLLNIKPIVVLEDGLLDVAEQTRTQRKAIERMIEMMVERVGTTQPVNLAVVHAEAPELGEELLDRTRTLFNCQEAFSANLTPTLAVHFGPGALMLFAYHI